MEKKLKTIIENENGKRTNVGKFKFNLPNDYDSNLYTKENIYVDEIGFYVNFDKNDKIYNYNLNLEKEQIIIIVDMGGLK